MKKFITAIVAVIAFGGMLMLAGCGDGDRVRDEKVASLVSDAQARGFTVISKETNATAAHGDELYLQVPVGLTCAGRITYFYTAYDNDTYRRVHIDVNVPGLLRAVFFPGEDVYMGKLRSEPALANCFSTSQK